MADALWMNDEAGAPLYHAAELRRAMAAAMTGGVADRLGARSGARPGAAVAELASTTWTVHGHPGVLYPGLTTTAGPYWVAVPDDSGQTASPDGTNPRKDILVARVYDDDEDSSTRRECVVEYIEGAPAVSPVEPAIPAGAYRIATITVPALGNGNPTIEVNPPYTVAAGGLLPVRDDTERPLGGLYSGLAVWRQDLKAVEVFDGSAWRALDPAQRVRKTAHQSVTNSTTRVLDDHLKFTAVANTSYLVDMFLMWDQAASAADAAIDFDLPSGTWSGGAVRPALDMVSGDFTHETSWSAVLDVTSFALAGGVSPSATTIWRFAGTVDVGATGGTVTLKWAQNTATNVSLFLRKGSWLRAERF